MAEVQIKDVEPMQVMSLAFTGPYDQTQDKLDELTSWLLRAGHPHSAPPLGLYYDDPAKVAAESLRAEVCLPIEEDCEPADEVQRKELPGAKVASVMHKGPYGETSAVYGEIFQWLQQNGYRHVEGQPSREVFHVVCGQVDNPEEYLTEVQVPVEKV